MQKRNRLVRWDGQNEMRREMTIRARGTHDRNRWVGVVG